MCFRSCLHCRRTHTHSHTRHTNNRWNIFYSSGAQRTGIGDVWVWWIAVGTGNERMFRMLSEITRNNNNNNWRWMLCIRAVIAVEVRTYMGQNKILYGNNTARHLLSRNSFNECVWATPTPAIYYDMLMDHGFEWTYRSNCFRGASRRVSAKLSAPISNNIVLW